MNASESETEQQNAWNKENRETEKETRSKEKQEWPRWPSFGELLGDIFLAQSIWMWSVKFGNNILHVLHLQQGHPVSFIIP